MNLFIDIETIPAQVEWVKKEIAVNVSPPGNIKKPESIEKWMSENKESAINNALLKTSFDGSIGEIICISYAAGDMDSVCIGRKLGESERDMLLCFNEEINNLFLLTKTPPVWIGHYICDFDLRFLWQRMKINKIENHIFIPHNSKPWSDNVFDTYYEWSGTQSKGFGSLDSLCKIFGLKQKGDIDGSKIWQAVQDGRYGEIYEYCNDDVDRVRDLYNLIK